MATVKLTRDAVGLSDSDSEAGQSDEAGADARQLLAAVDSSSEEDLDDEQLEQASMLFICPLTAYCSQGLHLVQTTC